MFERSPSHLWPPFFSSTTTATVARCNPMSLPSSTEPVAVGEPADDGSNDAKTATTTATPKTLRVPHRCTPRMKYIL